ncbi:uncharacterized protein LOC132783624 [Drosophila nasuta]|uniref:Uncharacterized protein LOC117565162 isoform X1 n=1 Tax=Drosophila albomicans TaxID=7291 RepID=A0A6P8XP29_DROAB|nr:uncharacterized protein LOC117565162 isoform X1 [Drosophila albomicans]XP_060644901.1 uncharacterized protein LOC132783624 [Drosophila nasuta]
MMRGTVLALGLLLVQFAATGLAVKCYECDSENDLNCGSEFQAEDIAKTDCDAVELPQEIREIYIQKPDTACLIKYYRDLPDNPLFVRRSCTFGDFSVCDEQPDPVMPHLSFLGCQFCHTDLCNNAAIIKRSIVSVMLLLLLGNLLN